MHNVQVQCTQIPVSLSCNQKGEMMRVWPQAAHGHGFATRVQQKPGRLHQEKATFSIELVEARHSMGGIADRLRALEV